MPATELAEIAHQTLAYLSPLISNNALVKIEDEAVEGAKKLAQDTYTLLQRTFKGNNEAESALALYKTKPEHTTYQEIVEGKIIACFEGNTAAINELTALIAQASTIGLVPHQIAQHIYNQTIKDSATVGVAVAGDVRGTLTNRSINTAGGDYTESSIDKRQGNFVSGDQFTMSGNFSGAILNIKSTLNDVMKAVSESPLTDQVAKETLQQLIQQLGTELEKAPTDEAEAVAEFAKQTVEQASKAKPNRATLQISAEGLKQAAQNLSAVLPTVLPIATKIVETVGTFAR